MSRNFDRNFFVPTPVLECPGDSTSTPLFLQLSWPWPYHPVMPRRYHRSKREQDLHQDRVFGIVYDIF